MNKILLGVFVLTFVAAIVFAVHALAGGNGSWRLLAAGDITCSPKTATKLNKKLKGKNRSLHCQSKKVVKIILDKKPDRVLALGDILQDGKPYAKRYLYFQDIWRPLVAKTYFIPGNHDYMPSGRAAGYFKYLHSRALNRSQTGYGQQGWSSWQKGSWQMIGLNANCQFIDCGLDGEQMTWLANKLYRSKKRCLAVYFHQPLFSVGRSRAQSSLSSPMRNFWNLLYMYGADLVINGHQHYYERYKKLDPRGRFDKKGMRQFIVGTGGYSLYAPGGRYHKQLKGAAFSYHGFGALMLDMKKNSYRWSFRTIKNKTIDRGGPNKCNRVLSQKQKDVSSVYRKRMLRLLELRKVIRSNSKQFRLAKGKHSKKMRLKDLRQSRRSYQAARFRPLY